MTAEEFPPDIGQFIVEHVSSVAQLEILLLLKSDNQRSWNPAEVSQALRTTPETAAEQLADLMARGLIIQDKPQEAFRFVPKSAELADIIERLSKIYEERRVSVITMIYSKPVDKVRTFADAFWLRKEK